MPRTPMQMLEIDEGRLAYWDAGAGTPLVLIHGVGTSGELWADDIAELADRCRLIVYDRRGYGASSASPRSWEAHRDDAAALIEALGAAPAIVVGYSGGAMVALDLALQRPELVSALVLLDPAFALRHCMTPGFVRHMLTAKLLHRLGRSRRGAEHWMRYVGSYPSGGSAFAKASAQRREKLLANASGIFADAGSGLGGHVPEERLAHLGIPVTIVDCRLSPPFLRKSCERLRGLMPQAQSVTLEHSGHHIAVDARTELLGALAAPLERDGAAREGPSGVAARPS